MQKHGSTFRQGRKENIWNLGVAKITGEPIKYLSTIEAPKWAKWNDNSQSHKS